MTPASEQVVAKLEAAIEDSAGVIRFYKDALTVADHRLKSYQIYYYSAIVGWLITILAWAWGVK